MGLFLFFYICLREEKKNGVSNLSAHQTQNANTIAWFLLRIHMNICAVLLCSIFEIYTTVKLNFFAFIVLGWFIQAYIRMCTRTRTRTHTKQV